MEMGMMVQIDRCYIVYRLKFIHPTKNTEMTVIAPLPEDLKGQQNM